MELDVFDDDFEKKLDGYVGKKIKAYRQRKKLSQEELGKLIGVGNSAISAYELGKNSLTLSMIFKIAKVLEVNVNDLFPETNQETDQEFKKEFIEELNMWDEKRVDALANFIRSFEKDR